MKTCLAESSQRPDSHGRSRSHLVVDVGSKSSILFPKSSNYFFITGGGSGFYRKVTSFTILSPTQFWLISLRCGQTCPRWEVTSQATRAA